MDKVQADDITQHLQMELFQLSAERDAHKLCMIDIDTLVVVTCQVTAIIVGQSI